ncbi:MAG: winged helix DNA-binding domain-containing protein [Thermomicrobiales bacterium]
MALSLSRDHLRWIHLRAQSLDPRCADATAGVAYVVRSLCGVQAQEPASADLAVRARCAGLVATDLERARIHDRSVVRTWAMRGTLHLVATEDLAWLLPLLGPIFIAASARRRAAIGLDDDLCARGIRAIRDVLAAQGPLTRDELVERLTARGIHLVGQARPHLISRAALEGVICFGPDRGAEPTYVLLDDWVDRGRAVSGGAALAELARRYLAAYGPAGVEDLATWSGVAIRELRSGWERIADERIAVVTADNAAWMLKERAGALWAGWLDEPPPIRPPTVRLLPRYDTYLLGYRHRDAIVAPRFAKRINAGGGILHPTLLVDGCVVGTWSGTRRRDCFNVAVKPFDDLAPAIQPEIEAEVADMGRFLGLSTTLHITMSS